MTQQAVPLLRTSAGLDRLAEIATGLAFEPGCASFLFVRHGQTECNARAVYQGPQEPLNAVGQAQAAACAIALAATPVATVVCSDMLRTRQTALALAHARALVPVPHADLRERNFGELIGTSSLHIDWAQAPQGGETLEAFVLRSRQGLFWALDRPGPVLVVAHGGTLHVLAGLLRLALPPGLLANAHPLLLARAGSGWSVQPLGRASAGGANVS